METKVINYIVTLDKFFSRYDVSTNKYLQFDAYFSFLEKNELGFASCWYLSVHFVCRLTD